MNIRAIRKAIRARPFAAFTMQLNDGREFKIAHPEAVAVGERTVFLWEPETDDPIWIEPVLIATMRFKHAKQNGKKPDSE